MFPRKEQSREVTCGLHTGLIYMPTVGRYCMYTDLGVQPSPLIRRAEAFMVDD